MVGCWGTAGRAAERCAAPVARIVSLQGRVEVQPAGSADWTSAALDDRLCIGDAIRSAAFAQAAIALANDSVLRLDQQTTMRLGGEPETGRSLLDLLFGDVHFFSHRPRALEIVTPIANAGTEGTEFLMRAGPDRTEVVTYEGRVRLRTTAGELLLASGDAALALAGAAPRAETLARPRDAVAWALYYPPILAPLAARGAVPSALPEGLQQAIARVGANDYAGALAALDAVPQAARDARYHAYRAGVLLQVGRVDEAAAAIEQALAQTPDAAEVLAERAVIEVVQNRREPALADAMRAVELAPASAPARIALSYALQANFELEAARATLREAAAQTPGDALVHARLAELELSFGDLDAAGAAATRAVTLAPELARTQMVLGFAALTRIEIDEAKAAFERAIALDSAEPLARLGLGLAKIRAGDLENGRRELEIAAALDPNNSLLRSYLGKAYFEERRGPQDADQFQIAKELDPNDPTPYFYDALRKQSENRPVQALRDLERSIALNDNRAVYRSRLLLDEDTAVRETSLARVYDDLGFEQLGVEEASKSLAVDPANHSAHRFLSDAYASRPRYEVARASELLQSQLLQPININPVQPSLPLTDLNVAAGAGPAESAFNEFTPLFERNRLQVTGTAVAGTNDTRGDELVASGLWNRIALSVGQFHSETDGFRDNNGVDNDVYDAFAQVEVTPKLSLQAEYRRRDTDHGDIDFDFDPDDFSTAEKRQLDQDVGRFGLRYAPTSNSDFLVSVFYADRRERTRDVDPTFGFVTDGSTDDTGYQTEAQYLFRSEPVNLTVGGGHYDIEVDQLISTDFGFGPFPFVDRTFDRKDDKAYAYASVGLPADLTLALGGAFDSYREDKFERNHLSPKLGLQWQVGPRLRLRVGYFQTVKAALSVQQTLEPTEVAGFNQLFDDPNGTKAKSYAAGLDARLAGSLYGGLEYQHRDLDVPVLLAASRATTNDNRDEDVYRAYLYWTPHDQWSVSGEVRYEMFDQGRTNNPAPPDSLNTLSLPLTVRYFSPSGLFGVLQATFMHQDVDRPTASAFDDGSEDVVLLDAAIGLRLPKRYGIISLEARNLLGQDYHYQDLNFLTSERRASPLTPERTILGRLTLSF